MSNFVSETNKYNHNKDEMILRDFLATDRTILANERTFLAYLRTFISFFAAGIGFIKFVDENIIVMLGYVLIFLSVIVLYFGCMRYLRTKKRYENIKY